MDIEAIKALIRDVPDFPEPGIVYKDITPVLADPIAFSTIIDLIVVHFGRGNVDKVVGIEARGFILAAPVAYHFGAGVVPVRKQGKLPWQTDRRGVLARVRIGDARDPPGRGPAGERVLVVDDVLATGGRPGPRRRSWSGSAATVVRHRVPDRARLPARPRRSSTATTCSRCSTTERVLARCAPGVARPAAGLARGAARGQPRAGQAAEQRGGRSCSAPAPGGEPETSSLGSSPLLKTRSAATTRRPTSTEIERAYRGRRGACTKGQKRLSGEDFIEHPVAVAHDPRRPAPRHDDARRRRSCTTRSRTRDVTVEEIEAEFGDEVARIVDGLTKLDALAVPAPASRSRPRTSAR